MISRVNNISFKQAFLTKDFQNRPETVEKIKKSADIVNLLTDVDVVFGLTTKNTLSIEVEKADCPDVALDYCLQINNQKELKKCKENYLFGQYIKHLCRDLLPKNSYKHISTDTMDKMNEDDILRETIIAIASHKATNTTNIN
jgi:hypothetical protein